MKIKIHMLYEHSRTYNVWKSSKTTLAIGALQQWLLDHFLLVLHIIQCVDVQILCMYYYVVYV